VPVIVKGIVHDSRATVEIERDTYLSIDMNCVQPQIAPMEHYSPKLDAVGIVIIDDYGFYGHEAQSGRRTDLRIRSEQSFRRCRLGKACC